MLAWATGAPVWDAPPEVLEAMVELIAGPPGAGSRLLARLQGLKSKWR